MSLKTSHNGRTLVLDTITIDVWTPPTPTPTPTPVTPTGDLSASKTSIDVDETVTVSAVNVVPSGQSVYIVTNGQLDFAGPGTCHFEINPRSSDRSAKSWTLEGCSPPGSGSVSLKTSHNGETLVLDTITIDVWTPPTPTNTPVSGQPTTVPTVPPTPPTVGPTDTPTNTPIPPTPTPTPSGGGQSLSFSETSVSLVFRAGWHATTTLPEAKGSSGSTTYSLSPAMGNGLTFDPQTRSVSGNAYNAADTAVYTYKAKDGAREATIQVEVTVFDILVAIRVGKNRKGTQSLSESHWGVFHSDNVYVFDAARRSDLSRFEFRIGIPGSVGFQTNTQTCRWPQPRTPVWTAWTAIGESFKLVRCTIGSGGYADIALHVRGRYGRPRPRIQDHADTPGVAPGRPRGQVLRYAVAPHVPGEAFSHTCDDHP